MSVMATLWPSGTSVTTVDHACGRAFQRDDADLFTCVQVAHCDADVVVSLVDDDGV